MSHRVLLMNSTVMPQPGGYHLLPLTRAEFVQAVQTAAHEGKLESYLGYPDAAMYVSQLTGIEVSVNRRAARLCMGDEILVCKLNCRAAVPGRRSRSLAIAERAYGFYRITYWPYHQATITAREDA